MRKNIFGMVSAWMIFSGTAIRSFRIRGFSVLAWMRCCYLRLLWLSPEKGCWIFAPEMA